MLPLPLPRMDVRVMRLREDALPTESSTCVEPSLKPATAQPGVCLRSTQTSGARMSRTPLSGQSHCGGTAKCDDLMVTESGCTV